MFVHFVFINSYMIVLKFQNMKIHGKHFAHFEHSH